MDEKFHEVEAELKHFGVMGMKWGRRRQKVVSVRGKPMIVSGNNRFNRTINKNPTKEQINKVARPLSSRLKANFDKSVEQKYGPNAKTNIQKMQTKAKELVATGKKKIKDLPENKKTALKLVGLAAGTTVATIALIKGSQATVNLIQKMDKMLYDDAINGMANAIIQMNNQRLGRS